MKKKYKYKIIGTMVRRNFLRKVHLLTSFLIVSFISNNSYVFPQDGLEDVIVEEITPSAGAIAADPTLSGYTTYRVYLNLAEDWGFLSVYGDMNGELSQALSINTTGSWYNQGDYGNTSGENIFGFLFGSAPQLEYDSWVSVGGATNTTLGQPGGDVAGTPNGTTLTTNIDVSMFDKTTSSTSFFTSSDGWAALVSGGVKGPDASNIILIGQFTTNGEFSFEMNVSLLPPGSSINENYVAKNARLTEKQFAGLTYPEPFVPVLGCTDENSCNYNPDATQDDGSCLTVYPEENCIACDGMDTTLVDDDGDGICNARENLGCTDPAACNYSTIATDDDGSCIMPVEGCRECTENYPYYVILDIDNDGICDSEDETGCTIDTACNYNPYATDDDGSCLIPVPNCTECFEDTLSIIDFDGDGICNSEDTIGCPVDTACNYDPLAPFTDSNLELCVFHVDSCVHCDTNDLGEYTGDWELIDTDGDGICDLEDKEISGCTSPTACNYDSTAINDDGSCIERPVAHEECYACVGDTFEIIDYDGDGICNRLDFNDCSIDSACNYNPWAGKGSNDGSCVFPVEGCTEYIGDGQWVVIDTDNDGICDSEEIVGCVHPLACNYDSTVTEHDASLCVYEVPYCTKCNGDGTWALIDADNDGICDMDDNALEDIVVETYYVSDDNDATDTDGGNLPEGSVTYRIFVDMTSGSELVNVYGDGNFNQSLIFSTTTQFFNNEDRGNTIGDKIQAEYLENNTVALDSWITIGFASDSHIGIPKADDTDGSIIGGENNDGGSEAIPGGLLVNNALEMEFPLTTFDGLMPVDSIETITKIGIENSDLFMFDSENDTTSFVVTGGSWGVLGGYGIEDGKNKVLIAQITTDGEFRFELNLDINAPPKINKTPPFNSVVPQPDAQGYVTRNPQPRGDETEFVFEGLVYYAVPGCIDASACNYDSAATVDNGTCVFAVENCRTCNGDGTWTTVDTDDDGICDAEEISGCMIDTACNYNPNATEQDNSSCLFADSCHTCDGDTLALIDVNQNDTCDALEGTTYIITELDTRKPFISVYPNPTRGKFTLAINNAKQNETYSYSVTDAIGKIILSKTLKAVNSERFEILIDVTTFSKGIYIIRVSSPGGFSKYEYLMVN